MIKSKSLEPNFRFLSYSNEKKGSIDSLKFLWLSAKWSELADIEYSKIEKIDSEGWGALLIGSANHVLGNIVRANELFLTAKRKGITEKTIKTTLFSNVLNSMARSFALKGDEEKALQYFNRSLLILLGESAAKLYENIRYISELGSLGLIPSAGKIINKRVDSIDLTQRPSIIESKLDIIKTELELINHNIMLSHQKNQFYNIPEEKSRKRTKF